MRDVSLTTLSRLLGVAAVLMIGVCGEASAGGPSFDCTQAMLPTENAICSDPKLAEMDLIIAKAFRRFTPEFGNRKTIRRAMIADRNACGSDVACIASVEVNAIETYGDPVDWATDYAAKLMAQRAAEHGATSASSIDEALPTAIGDCATTRIDDLGTRFSETLPEVDNGEGSRVDLKNGGTQVSYSHEPALVGSKVGDPVVTCLISIPRDCPAGDDRGRGYFSLNLRTKGSWSLGDSQHMCGGA